MQHHALIALYHGIENTPSQIRTVIRQKRNPHKHKTRRQHRIQRQKNNRYIEALRDNLEIAQKYY